MARTLRMPRQLGAVVLVTVLGLVGCTSTKAAQPPPTPTATPSSTATVSITRTASATTAAATTTAARSVAPSPSARSTGSVSGSCTNAELAVRGKPAGGGDSHSGVIVLFTNRSGTSCTLYGYPGAADLDTSGRQILQAKRTLTGYLGGCGCARPGQIQLSPGATASSLVEGDNGGGDECLRGRAILVTPPNTTAATRIPFQDYSCHFQVHPVVPGTNGTRRRKI